MLSFLPHYAMILQDLETIPVESTFQSIQARKEVTEDQDFTLIVSRLRNLRVFWCSFSRTFSWPP